MNQPNQYSMFPASEIRLRYAIHLHHATQVHYDLRLEISGHAQSWVIKPGPSLNPRHSRELLRMDDHKLTCLESEGRIPAGNYGAGPLMMWDRGTYSIITDEDIPQEMAFERGLEQGMVHLRLDGKKLAGDWLMVYKRTKWYLQKLPDAYASTRDVLLQDESVLTGRRIADL